MYSPDKPNDNYFINDLSFNLEVLRYYLSKAEIFDLKIINQIFRNLTGNFNQIFLVPLHHKIEIYMKFLNSIGILVFSQNYFTLFEIVQVHQDEISKTNSKNNEAENYFLQFCRLFVKYLDVNDLSEILNYNNNFNGPSYSLAQKFNLQSQVISQDSIKCILILKRIFYLFGNEDLASNNEVAKKLKEISFVIDFILSNQSKFLKILKFGKTYFNFQAIFKDMTSDMSSGINSLKISGRRLISKNEQNIIKKIFVVLNSFDESNVPLEINVKKINEENLTLVIYNRFIENLDIDKHSFKQSMKLNIYNDLSSLLNEYLKFIEHELEKMENEDYSLDKTKIDHRLKILEVCVVLLMKKKEFPIFKILADICLAYFRASFDHLNFDQMIMLLKIFSQDNFILYYDNTIFASELLQNLLQKLIIFINFKDTISQYKIFEIIVYLDKLGFFRYKRFLKDINMHSKEEKKITDQELNFAKFTDYLLDGLINIFSKTLKRGEINYVMTNNDKLMTFYLFSLKLKRNKFNSPHPNMMKGYYNPLLILRALQDFLLFEEDSIRAIFNKLLIQEYIELNYQTSCIMHILKSKNEMYQYDKYMDDEMYFLDFKKIDSLFSILMSMKFNVNDTIEIFGKILKKRFVEISSSSNTKEKNFVEKYFIISKNKLFIETLIIILFYSLNIKKEILVDSLVNLNNMELLSFINLLE